MHRSGRGRRYAALLRERDAHWAGSRRQRGARWRQLSAELGISAESLRRWVSLAASHAPALGEPTPEFDLDYQDARSPGYRQLVADYNAWAAAAGARVVDYVAIRRRFTDAGPPASATGSARKRTRVWPRHRTCRR